MYTTLSRKCELFSLTGFINSEILITMFACNCFGIDEKTLREHLNKVAGPVTPEEVHSHLSNDAANCCGECRREEGDRLFVQIVKGHNARHGQKNYG